MIHQNILFYAFGIMRCEDGAIPGKQLNVNMKTLKKRET